MQRSRILAGSITTDRLKRLARSKYFLTLSALVCAFLIFYSTYHVRVRGDGALSLDKRSAPCVGPQLKPVKRPEPQFSFARELAKEVARDDAVQVHT